MSISTADLTGPNKTVKFKGWDKVQRPIEDLAELAEFKFDLGEFNRKVDDMYVIDWHDSETDKPIRSLHHESEFEFYTPPISLDWKWPNADEEREEKKSWLARHRLKTYSRIVNNKKEYFFKDSQERERSLAEVSKAYTKYKLCRIIYARLKIICQLDLDRARTENGVGFSKFDSSFGHSLAEQFEKYDSWSNNQLLAAIKLTHRYKRQYQILIGIKLPPFTSLQGYDFGLKEPLSAKFFDTTEAVPETHTEIESDPEQLTFD